MKVYAAYHKNKTVVSESSSGGVFTAISDYVLDKNGYIYGAKYDYNRHCLEHVLCKTKEDRDALRGSKYFQSNLLPEIFEHLTNALIEGRLCLFVGTPCQVNAILKFIEIKKVERSNLITCDILCHGVGNPTIWSNFVYWLEKRKKIKITFISFKNKRDGWKNPRCIATNGTKEVSLRGYSWLYFSNNIMRPSCYQCKYANLHRKGDVTIGDFWGIEEKIPSMFNEIGTSLLMVNSEIGAKTFDSIKDNIIYDESNLQDCLQPNLINSTSYGKYHTKITEDFTKLNISMFICKWKLLLLLDKLKEKLYNK